MAKSIGMWPKPPRLRRRVLRAGFFLALAGVFVLTAAESNRGTAWAGRLPHADSGDGPVFRGVHPPRGGSRSGFQFYSAPDSAPGSGPAVPRRRMADHAWFWDEVPAARGARAGLGLAAALEVVLRRRREQGGLVTESEARSVIEAYGSEIDAAATRHKVSPALVAAVIAVESAGRRLAVSPKGAQGLMQLMPATGRRFGVTDPFDAAANILAGTAYLDWLLEEFGEDPVLALAGYNAGEGAVARHEGVPPFAETRDYVVRVLDAFAAARELCVEVPTSPRAPCVLADADAGDVGEGGPGG